MLASTRSTICVSTRGLAIGRDVRELAANLEVMGDVIVNHVSSSSPQFLDWSAHGDASDYAGMFLTLDAVFPQGATEADLLAIYRPRPGVPLTVATLANGQRKLLWTTFTPQQVDIDIDHPRGKAYLDAILARFAANGVTHDPARRGGLCREARRHQLLHAARDLRLHR